MIVADADALDSLGIVDAVKQIDCSRITPEAVTSERKEIAPNDDTVRNVPVL